MPDLSTSGALVTPRSLHVFSVEQTVSSQIMFVYQVLQQFRLPLVA